MVTVRDAATVMLVRDAPGADGQAGSISSGAGMEVFMLRRNLNSDFVGGAYVFPGGGVDEADRDADLEAVCRGLPDDAASARLGIERGGLAFWVAAIRECFEEAGVLLAEPLALDDPTTAERFRQHRKAVDTGERRLVDVCVQEGLQLTVDRVHYFSHWITPEGPPRRYDTRFFVAAAPAHQEPLHDDRETIASLWVRPADALERHRRGELDLIFPTIRNLEAISRFDTAAALLDAAARITDVPAIQPRIVRDGGGGTRILLPGDAGYDDAMTSIPDGMPMPGRPGGPEAPQPHSGA